MPTDETEGKEKMISFNPYAKTDHQHLMEKLGSGLAGISNKYLTLRFDARAIANIEDRYQRITIGFHDQQETAAVEQLTAHGQRIVPVARDDTLTGRLTHYSGHLVPQNAGDIELAVEGKDYTYQCFVSLSTVVAYNITTVNSKSPMPAAWKRQQRSPWYQIKKGLESVLRRLQRSPSLKKPF